MKKGIAFVLAAVMCLGFVGCGKEITAETVFDALSKKGKLVFDGDIEEAIEYYETKY